MIHGKGRRRSAAVSLVLAGGVAGALTGCDAGTPQRDAYRNLADCTRDWNDASLCEPVRDGRFAPGYHYGPHYYGQSFGDGRPRPSANAMDAVRTPGHTGPIGRGGFGSTARSFSSIGG